MSTVDPGPTHPNGLKEDTELSTSDHARPHEASAMTVSNPDPESSVTPHPEVHVSDGGVADHASVVPDIPQTVPPHPETQPELDHEDATKSTGNGHHTESEGTDEEEAEDEGDEDDSEEEEAEAEAEDEDDDDDEDEDVEPTLKYERFGGAFQDLLKKDSASALVVSNKYLVRDVILA